MSVGCDGTTPVPATAVTLAFGRSRRTASARDTAGYEDVTKSSSCTLSMSVSSAFIAALASAGVTCSPPPIPAIALSPPAAPPRSCSSAAG